MVGLYMHAVNRGPPCGRLSTRRRRSGRAIGRTPRGPSILDAADAPVNDVSGEAVIVVSADHADQSVTHAWAAQARPRRGSSSARNTDHMSGSAYSSCGS